MSQIYQKKICQKCIKNKCKSHIYKKIAQKLAKNTSKLTENVLNLSKNCQKLSKIS